MGASPERRERREQDHINAYAAQQGEDGLAQSGTLIDRYRSKWQWELALLAQTRRTWIGAPDRLDTRLLERYLLTDGRALITNDVYGPVVLRMGSMGKWDAQENYPQTFGTGADGTNVMNTTPADSVIVWDNLLRTPLTPMIDEWAQDLARCDAQIAQNVAQQTSFFLLSVDQRNESDARAIMRNMGLGEPGQIRLKPADKQADPIEPKVLTTGIQPIMDKLYDARQQKLNEAYAFLGINHIAVEKQERLVTAEAEVSDDVIHRQREAYMTPARTAVDQINRIFGWGMSVEWNDPAVETNGKDENDDDPAPDDPQE